MFMGTGLLVEEGQVVGDFLASVVVARDERLVAMGAVGDAEGFVVLAVAFDAGRFGKHLDSLGCSGVLCRF